MDAQSLEMEMQRGAKELVGQFNLFPWFDDQWKDLGETKRNECVEKIAEILR